MYRTKKIQLPEKINRATTKHISPRAHPGIGWLSGDSVVVKVVVVGIDGVVFAVIVVVTTVVVVTNVVVVTTVVVDIDEVIVDIDEVVVDIDGVDDVEVGVGIDVVIVVGTTVVVLVDVEGVEVVVALVAVVPGVVNLIDDEFKDLLAIVVLGVLITFITISKPFLISSLIAFKFKSDIVISSSSKATVLS